jgi:hypothetical protein
MFCWRMKCSLACPMYRVGSVSMAFCLSLGRPVMLTGMIKYKKYSNSNISLVFIQSFWMGSVQCHSDLSLPLLKDLLSEKQLYKQTIISLMSWVSFSFIISSFFSLPFHFLCYRTPVDLCFQDSSLSTACHS